MGIITFYTSVLQYASLPKKWVTKPSSHLTKRSYQYNLIRSLYSMLPVASYPQSVFHLICLNWDHPRTTCCIWLSCPFSLAANSHFLMTLIYKRPGQLSYSISWSVFVHCLVQCLAHSSPYTLVHWESDLESGLESGHVLPGSSWVVGWCHITSRCRPQHQVHMVCSSLVKSPPTPPCSLRVIWLWWMVLWYTSCTFLAFPPCIFIFFLF